MGSPTSAPPASVLRLVLGDGGRLAAIGITAGIAVALTLTRLLADLLYGVGPTDSLTFVAAALVLAAASLSPVTFRRGARWVSIRSRCCGRNDRAARRANPLRLAGRRRDDAES